MHMAVGPVAHGTYPSEPYYLSLCVRKYGPWQFAEGLAGAVLEDWSTGNGLGDVGDVVVTMVPVDCSSRIEIVR